MDACCRACHGASCSTSLRCHHHHHAVVARGTGGARAQGAAPPPCLHARRLRRDRCRGAARVCSSADAGPHGVPSAVDSPPPPSVLRSPFASSSPPQTQTHGAGGGAIASWSAINAGVFGDVISGGSAPPGARGLPGSRKAELYLVRTDGFTCTRETVKDATLRFNHPSTQQQLLIWKTRPQSVLVLKKLGDALLPELMTALRVLRHECGLRCVVERDVYDRLSSEDGFGFVETFYAAEVADGRLAGDVDFVVCLGGDGVILHASSLFSGPAPPIISFNLGSLGFLTSHRFEDFAADVRALTACGDASGGGSSAAAAAAAHDGGNGNGNGNGTSSSPRSPPRAVPAPTLCDGPLGLLGGAYITLRMRLQCDLVRRGGVVEHSFTVLNEMVVNRGSNPYLTKIECYERDRLITKVQADGIIIATPTGSTAYSASAGGSMVHPSQAAMLFTPVCPHSLSFRPVVLPDSAELELRIPRDARDTAWVSFDGKARHELKRGDSVRVRMSPFPLPTINKADQTNDWFSSLGRCLGWNERVEQGTLESPV